MQSYSDQSILDAKYDRSQYTLSNPAPWKILEQIKGKVFSDYRSMLAKAEKGEILTDFPLEVLIKTTLNCNHFCPKCLHGMGVFPRGPKYNMNFDTLKKVLDEGARKGLQSVVFTGGEPTLHPQITKFIRYAGELGFPDISMVTNGSKLTPKLIECLISSGMTRINVSLDSTTPETFEKVRGIDHFGLVTKNIERFLSIRKERGGELPLLSLSFVLSEENDHELDAFIARWKDRADGGIKIYPYKNIFSVVDSEFSKTYGAGEKEIADLDVADLPIALPKSVPIVSEYNVMCTIPWYRCHVGINGELQACTTQGFADHPQMVMGNIHDSTFEKTWKSARWSELRRIVLSKQYDLHPVCKICQRCV